MKRFWLVLLSLGLVLAFSASAMAVDVKFSGSYYAGGMYLDKTTLNKDSYGIPYTRSMATNSQMTTVTQFTTMADGYRWEQLGVGFNTYSGLASNAAMLSASAFSTMSRYSTANNSATVASGNSTAFYYQRLRVQTDFIVSPGLKLVTRFDAMERIWGAARSGTGTTLTADSAGTLAENENIAIDWAYINYASPIGTFDVGMMNDGSTGTIFGNSYAPAGRIKYSYTMGPATLNASYTKVKDQSLSYVAPTTTATDVDNDKWGIEGVYAWKGGKAGVQVAYYRYAEKRSQMALPATPANAYNFAKTYFLFTPYAIAKIGPVALQAEFNYATGKSKVYDSSTVGYDVNLQNMSGWIDATADFGKFYFGGSFAYISGDDPGNTDKEEGGTLNGGRDWNPTLIMFNYLDRQYWVGSLSGYDSTADVGTMGSAASSSNTAPGAWFFQGRVGVKPIAALDIMASLSYANADKKPQNVLNNDFGWEADLTGTYKITNNLSYMLGAGFLWTGKYFQGANTTTSNEIQNTYILMNKLTLTF